MVLCCSLEILANPYKKTIVNSEWVSTPSPFAVRRLLETLQQLDVDAQAVNGNGCPPVRVRARSTW